jgi:hypothetical protein
MHTLIQAPKYSDYINVLENNLEGFWGDNRDALISHVSG